MKLRAIVVDIRLDIRKMQCLAKNLILLYDRNNYPAILFSKAFIIKLFWHDSFISKLEVLKITNIKQLENKTHNLNLFLILAKKKFLVQLIFRIFLVLGIYISLTSATPVLKRDTSKIHQQNMILPIHNSNSLKFHKLNFFQRLMVKFYFGKHKLQKDIKADKLASASLWLGIGACGLICLSLLFPYFIFLSLPAGITAMITGRSAIRNKTSFARKARMGKALGLLAIIIFAVLFVIVVYILATSGGSSFD